MSVHAQELPEVAQIRPKEAKPGGLASLAYPSCPWPNALRASTHGFKPPAINTFKEKTMKIKTQIKAGFVTAEIT